MSGNTIKHGSGWVVGGGFFFFSVSHFNLSSSTRRKLFKVMSLMTSENTLSVQTELLECNTCFSLAAVS